jgi:hypothetical protein
MPLVRQHKFNFKREILEIDTNIFNATSLKCLMQNLTGKVCLTGIVDDKIILNETYSTGKPGGAEIEWNISFWLMLII